MFTPGGQRVGSIELETASFGGVSQQYNERSRLRWAEPVILMTQRSVLVELGILDSRDSIQEAFSTVAATSSGASTNRCKPHFIRVWRKLS